MNAIKYSMHATEIQLSKLLQKQINVLECFNVFILDYHTYLFYPLIVALKQQNNNSNNNNDMLHFMPLPSHESHTYIST